MLQDVFVLLTLRIHVSVPEKVTQEGLCRGIPAHIAQSCIKMLRRNGEIQGSYAVQFEKEKKKLAGQ
jgi:hypothetical protein